MSFAYANNVNTQLASPITTTTQTHITLASSANLPTLGAGEVFVVTLNDAATQSVFEIVYATAISGATLTVLRGQEGTAAATWLSGDFAYGPVTAGILNSFAASGTGVESITAGTGIAVSGGSTPTISNSGVLSVNGSGGVLTGIVDDITSNDGTVTVTPHVGGTSYDLSIEKTGGYAAGNVQYRLRYNYSTASNSLMLPSGDGSGGQNSISPLGSLLGATAQNTGASNSTIESVFLVDAIGSQAIGGSCNQNGGYVAVFIDGTLLTSQSSPSGSFTWSTTISGSHTVVLHVDDAVSGGINCIWSAWLPQNTYGGLDTSKFSSATPGA